MDIGDYLYLIIFLGAALFSYVSKAMDTKSRAQEDVPAEKSKKSPNHKVVIPQKMDSEVVVSKSRNTIEESSATIDITSLSKRHIAGITPESYAVSSIPEPAIELLDSKDGDDCEITFDFSGIDDVKRGIIYSEILNRKY
ncbi:MAG: hypothetical protein ACRC6R_01680 [Bacteroidales bacterium]